MLDAIARGRAGDQRAACRVVGVADARVSAGRAVGDDHDLARMTGARRCGCSRSTRRRFIRSRTAWTSTASHPHRARPSTSGGRTGCAGSCASRRAGTRRRRRPGSVRLQRGGGARRVLRRRNRARTRPVLMYVGRFLAFKRVPLLVRAYARARERMTVPAPLVIWGGWPGEWEGEHPHTVVTRERIKGVFFDGWRDHDQLPLGLSCADCFVAPSTDEPFGLVYLEAMACELACDRNAQRRAAQLHQRHAGRARRAASDRH